MKILLVHNNYGKYSGEEAVVDKMAAMLQSHNHTVCFYRLTTEGARDTISDKRIHSWNIFSHRSEGNGRNITQRKTGYNKCA